MSTFQFVFTFTIGSLLLYDVSGSVSHRSFLRVLEEHSPGIVNNTLNSDAFVEVEERLTDKTTPFFWHIPKAGGTSVGDIVSYCLGVVTASEVGAGNDDHGSVELIQLEDGSRFVDVDTTDPKGLAGAKARGFAESELAGLIISPFPPAASNALFDETHKGSMFSILRHPSERAISLFYYLRDADWEPTYHPEWKSWTLTDYLESDFAEHNWMLRYLIGKHEGELTEEDLTQAKRFISTNVWVGLLSKMKESMDRFGALYGWDTRPKWDGCLEQYTRHGSNRHHHPEFHHGSEEWELLEKSNNFDLQLYAHAVEVFEQQRDYFVGLLDEA